MDSICIAAISAAWNRLPSAIVNTGLVKPHLAAHKQRLSGRLIHLGCTEQAAGVAEGGELEEQEQPCEQAPAAPAAIVCIDI